MYLKIHESENSRVVAVCDKELIGKVLEDESTHMDLDKYRGFYTDKVVERDAVEEALSSFTSVNLVGEKSVNVAINMGIVNKNDIMYINRIPYIQIYKI